MNPAHVILSGAKNLHLSFRVNSAKNLLKFMNEKIEILRLMPQNDNMTQPLKGEELLIIRAAAGTNQI